MKIAWQYQKQSAEQMMSRHTLKKNLGINKLDINNKIDLETVNKKIHFHKIHGFSSAVEILVEIENFYQKLQAKMPNEKMLHKKVAFRTVISGLNNLFWPTDVSVFEFLTQLKSISPINSFTLISVDSSDKIFLKKLRRSFDIAIKLTNLVPQLLPTEDEFVQNMPKKMGYHGLLSLTKVNMSQNLNPTLPDSNDMVFKFNKIGGLQIERLHLPPEGSVAAEKMSSH